MKILFVYWKRKNYFVTFQTIAPTMAPAKKESATVGKIEEEFFLSSALTLSLRAYFIFFLFDEFF